MTIFFTSDNHFYHKNILDFTSRPFDTIEDMNQGMIKAWNDVVRKTDTVYVLGDFCFGNASQWLDTLNQLRGNIILIQGNHDKTKIIKRAFKEGYIADYHSLGIMLKEQEFYLNLSHYPMLIGNRPNNFSIHGHLHEEEHNAVNSINIGVDSPLLKSLNKPFGTPISLNELIEHLREVDLKLLEEK